MSGVAGTSPHENAVLWDELSSLGTRIALGSMILMDPGSLAFDDPSRFGYERKASTLKDHLKALSLPSWHQWFNYSLPGVNSSELAEILLGDMEEMLSLRHRKKLIPTGEYQRQEFQIGMYRMQIREIEKIFKMKEQSRSDRLWTLAYACTPNQDLTERDPYGYNAMILEAARKAYEGDTNGNRSGRRN